MNTTVPRIPAHFEATIKVAGLTVAPCFESGAEVALDISGDLPGEFLTFTPSEARALAAALTAVSVHVDEEAVA